MTILRLFGLIFFIVLIVAWAHHWSGPAIVAWMFWLGVCAICVWLLARLAGWR